LDSAERTPAAADQSPPPSGGVTWRAAVISLAVILVSAPAIFYGEVVWSKGVWSSGVPSTWPLVVLFLLGAAGSIPFLRRFALTRKELLTVYCVVLVATPLLSINVIFWALSQPISYYYFAQAFPSGKAPSSGTSPPGSVPPPPPLSRATSGAGPLCRGRSGSSPSPPGRRSYRALPGEPVSALTRPAAVDRA